MSYRPADNVLTLTTDQLAEPVTLAAAKSWLSVDTADDDDLITAMISAARIGVEQFLRRSLVQRTYTAHLPYFDECIALPLGPVVSVVSIKYWSDDSPSVFTTLSDTSSSPLVTSTLWRLNLDDAVYLRDGALWPTTDPRHDAVQITYKAGYAHSNASPTDHADKVPDPIKTAIKILVAEQYMYREKHSVLNLSENNTVGWLLQPWRNYA